MQPRGRVGSPLACWEQPGSPPPPPAQLGHLKPAHGPAPTLRPGPEACSWPRPRAPPTGPEACSWPRPRAPPTRWGYSPCSD